MLATRPGVRTAPCARPVVAPHVPIAHVPRSSTQCKAVSELAMLAAGAVLTPSFGIPSAAAVYFTARYLIPAYQNYAPSAPSAVPEDMPEYKHRTKDNANTCPKMKHGKKAHVPLKSTGTIHIRRR